MIRIGFGESGFYSLNVFIRETLIDILKILNKIS